MARTVIFDSDFGEIYLEVSDDVFQELSPPQGTTKPLSSPTSAEPVKVPKSFGDAMSSLEAYTRTIQSVVGEMRPIPNEASIEVGLKLDGSLNFKVVKVGSSADFKINIKWDPGGSIT